MGLTKEDVKQIGEEVGRVIEQNVNPQFEDLRHRLDKVEATMVTKSYLDDKLADLEGSVITRQRKEDQKVNLLIELLQRKSILVETDVKALREIQVFPTTSV